MKVSFVYQSVLLFIVIQNTYQISVVKNRTSSNILKNSNRKPYIQVIEKERKLEQIEIDQLSEKLSNIKSLDSINFINVGQGNGIIAKVGQSQSMDVVGQEQEQSTKSSSNENAPEIQTQNQTFEPNLKKRKNISSHGLDQPNVQRSVKKIKLDIQSKISQKQNSQSDQDQYTAQNQVDIQPQTQIQNVLNSPQSQVQQNPSSQTQVQIDITESQSDEEPGDYFVFDMGTASRTYVEKFFSDDLEKYSPRESLQQIQSIVENPDNQKNVTFFLTHDDKDHYSLMPNFMIKKFYVSEYVFNKVNNVFQVQNDAFKNFYKKNKSIINAEPIKLQKQTIYYDKVLVLNSPYITLNNVSQKNDNSVIFVIKIQDKYFMLPGDATRVTLGVDDKNDCQQKDDATQEQKDALTAYQKIAPLIDYFVYPHHGTATDGSYCLFDILTKEKKANDSVLEGVIFSSGIQNSIKHPSRFAINKVYEYFQDSGKDYTGQDWKRLMYYIKDGEVPVGQQQQQEVTEEEADVDSLSTEDQVAVEFDAEKDQADEEDLCCFKNLIDLKKNQSKNKKVQITLAQTKYPIFVTSTLGLITYNKSGIQYSNTYTCEKLIESSSTFANCYKEFYQQDTETLAQNKFQISNGVMNASSHEKIKKLCI